MGEKIGASFTFISGKEEEDVSYFSEFGLKKTISSSPKFNLPFSLGKRLYRKIPSDSNPYSPFLSFANFLVFDSSKKVMSALHVLYLQKP